MLCFFSTFWHNLLIQKYTFDLLLFDLLIDEELILMMYLMDQRGLTLIPCRINFFFYFLCSRIYFFFFFFMRFILERKWSWPMKFILQFLFCAPYIFAPCFFRHVFFLFFQPETCWVDFIRISRDHFFFFFLSLLIFFFRLKSSKIQDK